MHEADPAEQDLRHPPRRTRAARCRRRRHVAAMLIVAGVTAMLATVLAPSANADEWVENKFIKLHVSDQNGPRKVVTGTTLGVPMTLETFNQAFYKTQFKQGTFTGNWPGCSGTTVNLSAGEQTTITCNAGPILTSGTSYALTVKGQAKKAGWFDWHDTELTADRFFTVVDPNYTATVAYVPSVPQAGSTVDVAITFTNTGGILGAGDFEKLSFVSNQGACFNPNLGAFLKDQVITVHCNVPTDPWDTELDFSGTASADLPGGAYSASNPNGTYPTNINTRNFGVIIPLKPPPPPASVSLQISDQHPNGWSYGSNIDIPVTVENTSTAAETISVASPLCSHDYGSVPPGVSQTWTCSVANATNSFDLNVIATASTGGAPVTQSAWEHFVVLPLPAPGVNVQITDTQPNGWAYGSNVTAPITVTNTTTADETISVASPQCNHNYGIVPAGQTRTWDCTIYAVQSGFALNVAASASTGGAPFVQYASEYFVVLPAAPPSVDVQIVDQQPNGWTWGSDIPIPIKVTNTSTSPETITVASQQCNHNYGVVNPGQMVTWTCVAPNVTNSFNLVLNATAANIGQPFVQQYTEYFSVLPLQVTIADAHPLGWDANQPIPAPVTITNPIFGATASNVSLEVISPSGATCAALSGTSIPSFTSVSTTCTIPGQPAGTSVALTVRVKADMNGVTVTGERSEVFQILPNVAHPGDGDERESSGGDGTPGLPGDAVPSDPKSTPGKDTSEKA